MLRKEVRCAEDASLDRGRSGKLIDEDLLVKEVLSGFTHGLRARRGGVTLHAWLKCDALPPPPPPAPGSLAARKP